MIRYDETSGFVRDLKKLSKRFRSLSEDIEVAKKYAIELFHSHSELDTHVIEEMSGLCTDEIRLCKIRKFTCRSLKGRGNMSGIRIVYAYWPIENRIDFIEIYFKGDKENEDRTRIKEYLNSL